MSKREQKKQEFLNLAAEIQSKKKAEFQAKYNNGAPATMVIPVIAKTHGTYTIGNRIFTFDNYLEIRHKLEGIVLMDMGKLHDGKNSYAIRTNTKYVEGSLPAYLFNLPRFTKRKSGTSAEDLRKECYNF